jgi:hypothetical protein
MIASTIHDNEDYVLYFSSAMSIIFLKLSDVNLQNIELVVLKNIFKEKSW